jgi:hypothetical protein
MIIIVNRNLNFFCLFGVVQILVHWLASLSGLANCFVGGTSSNDLKRC